MMPRELPGRRPRTDGQVASREFLRQQQAIIEETRLAKLEMTCAGILGEHVIQRLDELDGVRETFARGDAMKNAMYAEVELTVFRQVRRIQNELFSRP